MNLTTQTVVVSVNKGKCQTVKNLVVAWLFSEQS